MGRRGDPHDGLSIPLHARRSSSYDHDHDHDPPPPRRPSSREEEEDLQELRRYEDFTTIDWVQDAHRSQTRKRLKLLSGERISTWRERLEQIYDDGQAWIVVSLVATLIGINAALQSIVTEWLSDLRGGYCASGWYLNRKFCCWESEGTCPEWRPYSTGIAAYPIFVCFAAGFAWVSAFLVREFAPYAAGSGISEIKCILAGFIMKNFLGAWTLLIKSCCLPLAIASGLQVGKEGPAVHVAVCTGSVVTRFFSKYRRDAGKMREIFTACSAAGVAVAFGAPIGGVLFAFEEMSAGGAGFPLKTLYRTFFCALISVTVLSALNPFRTGQLVLFQVTYDRDWHFFEIVNFLFLGVAGGLYGAFVMKWNIRYVAFRKRYLARWGVPEVVGLAVATGVVGWWNRWVRMDMTKGMEMLFRECAQLESWEDEGGLCEYGSRWRVSASLLIATVMRIFFVIISYGAKIPAGIFVPSMAVGATFGRLVGIVANAIQQTFPTWSVFAVCSPDVPCITPGTYAFLGAAAALSGIMHISVSVVVIMFELTGALNYVLPCMIVVGATKGVSEYLGKGGIADRMIAVNGYPFLDSKEERNFGGVRVGGVMQRARGLRVVTVRGMRVRDVEGLLRETEFRGFPVVGSESEMVLVGWIGRREIRYGLERADVDVGGRDDVECVFGRMSEEEEEEMEGTYTPDLSAPAPAPTYDTDPNVIDFTRYVDPTPLTVHPALPLETCSSLFQSLGPRVILVEHYGKLRGLVTVKDLLKFTAMVENREHPRDYEGEEEEQRRAWDFLGRVGRRVRGVSGDLRGRLMRERFGLLGVGEERVRRAEAAGEFVLEEESESEDDERGLGMYDRNGNRSSGER
ncbi:glycerol ethanol, ferric requiring protein [Saitoella coloradoensis]